MYITEMMNKKCNYKNGYFWRQRNIEKKMTCHYMENKEKLHSLPSAFQLEYGSVAIFILIENAVET